MIKPHPESDMKLNIMVLGSDIISTLNSKSFRGKYVLVENVLNEFLKRDEKRTLDLFVYALTFLYTVGLIQYEGYKITLTPITEKQQLNLFPNNADTTLL